MGSALLVILLLIVAVAAAWFYVEYVMSARCNGINRTGERCRRAVQGRRGYCHDHRWRS